MFCGSLIGGSIGNQFGSGSGSGRAMSTILGAMLDGSMANESQSPIKQIAIQLIELMISIDDDEFMVVQCFDPAMRFQAQYKIRMINLANGSVRIDKQY